MPRDWELASLDTSALIHFLVLVVTVRGELETALIKPSFYRPLPPIIYRYRIAPYTIAFPAFGIVRPPIIQCADQQQD
jgi:hypothetical protein